jgi:hypothetical protein
MSFGESQFVSGCLLETANDHPQTRKERERENKEKERKKEDPF